MEVKADLKYLDGWFDKKKNRQRWRVRRKGFPNIELPPNSDPNTSEFLAAYYAALRGEQPNEAAAAVAARGGSGSVKDAIEKYLNSTTFNDYEVSTQELRRPILKAFLEPEIARLPIAQMDREYLEGWLETAPTMGVKRTWLLTVRPFFQWASSPGLKLVANDPTVGIKVKARESNGHHSWIDEEVEQYRSHFSLGTMARLALELLICLGPRRGDAISLGKQHMKGDRLIYTQEKNRRRHPMDINVRMPAELVAAIQAYPNSPGCLTFLANSQGRPFSKRAFNAQFRTWCDEAGLPERCVPHGLRKGHGRIMAESDCTASEIMASLGHRTLKEAERYTRAFNRAKANDRAQEKVAEAKAKAVAAQAELEAESNVVTLPVASR